MNKVKKLLIGLTLLLFIQGIVLTSSVQASFIDDLLHIFQNATKVLEEEPEVDSIFREGVDVSEACDGSVLAKLSEDKKVLTISGRGRIKKTWNHFDNVVPWEYYENMIETIVIEDGVEDLGNYTFEMCKEVWKVEINSNLTRIGCGVFLGCSHLMEINIPDGVTSIENSAFSHCEGLINIDIPSSVTNIGDYAFFECSSLTSVIGTNGLVSLGEDAFGSCSKLANITIPSSVTNIGDGCFFGCKMLKNIDVDEENINYVSENSVLYSKDKTVIKCCANTEEIFSIPNNVIKIENSAFKGCENLISIEIPNSVTSIGDSAFYGCENLVNIEIPNSVTSIGEYAFTSCLSINNIVIPNGITSIEDGTFLCCINLISVKIPNSVTSIGESAFSSCSNLTNIEIPNTVTSIENGTFNECESLTNVEIPSSVTKIDRYAFSMCTSLKQVLIPKEVEYIYEDEVFDYCSSELTLTCKSGTIAENYAREHNINYVLDDEVLFLELQQSTDENGNIIVTITSEEPLRGLEGWTLSEDRKVLTKMYDKNTSEEITIIDLVGNEVKKNLEIDSFEGISAVYAIEGEFIKNILPNTNFESFKENISKGISFLVKEGDIEVTGTDKIKTGQVFAIGDVSYTVVVTGDTNGDGDANIKDILQVNKHRLNKAQLSGECFIAGDVNKDGKVDIKDILWINKYRLKKISEF